MATGQGFFQMLNRQGLSGVVTSCFVLFIGSSAMQVLASSTTASNTGSTSGMNPKMSKAAKSGIADSADQDTRAESARKALLNKLHDALAASTSEREAQQYSQQIWAVWLSHPDPVINKLMQDVLVARQRSQFDLAISLLNEIIEREPAYAEAWNQRATIFFLVGKYEKSLEDVAETLKREPRHFGALSGRGMIRLRQGRDALAWQNFEAARKIHPYIGGRQLIPKSVRETDT